MRCHECEDKITLYIDGLLTKEETENMKAHIAECEECRQGYRQTNKMVDILKQIEPVNVPLSFHSDLMDKIEKERQSNEDKKIINIQRWSYKKALPIVAVLMSGFILFSSGNIIIKNKQSSYNGEEQNNYVQVTNNSDGDESQLRVARGINEMEEMPGNEWYIDINNKQVFIEKAKEYLEQKKWKYTIDDISIQIDNGSYDELIKWLESLEEVDNIDIQSNEEPPFTIIYNE